MSPDDRRSADDESAGLFIVSGQLPHEFESIGTGNYSAEWLARAGDSDCFRACVSTIRLGAPINDAAPDFPSQGS